jgi:hypothetical protein
MKTISIKHPDPLFHDLSQRAKRSASNQGQAGIGGEVIGQFLNTKVGHVGAHLLGARHFTPKSLMNNDNSDFFTIDSRTQVLTETNHPRPNRQRTRQPRRLDAEEVDQARHTVLGRALNHKVTRCFMRRIDLGADACVAG